LTTAIPGFEEHFRVLCVLSSIHATFFVCAAFLTSAFEMRQLSSEHVNFVLEKKALCRKIKNSVHIGELSLH